jgi:hypothetical protein
MVITGGVLCWWDVHTEEFWLDGTDSGVLVG